MRILEKISFEQFSKDISNNKDLYLEYNVPRRGTMYSAGYDFYAILDFVIHPGEIKKIPTGIKVSMCSDEMFVLCDRSSVGFKYNVRLTNQVGIIDHDYYNNEDNEGHMWFSLQNHGDKDFIVKKGQAFAQGIFMKYLVTDDDNVSKIRESGIGSTNKE